MGLSRGFCGGIWSPAPKVMLPGGRDDSGRHDWLDVPLRRRVKPSTGITSISSRMVADSR